MTSTMYHVQYMMSETSGWQEFISVSTVELALQAASMLFPHVWQVRIVKV